VTFESNRVSIHGTTVRADGSNRVSIHGTTVRADGPDRLSSTFY